MGNINYKQAKFLKSVAELTQLPLESDGEVAFIGRSNVGKSSVINVLTGQRALAKVSRTPGRTQLINFFTLGGERALVDLPGYGFAKVPRATQKRWHATVPTYLTTRSSLKGLILIMDIRHPLKDTDLQLLTWMNDYQIKTHILLNKSDKLSRHAVQNTLRQVNSALSAYPDTTVQIFSVLKKQGLDELIVVLDQWFHPL